MKRLWWMTGTALLLGSMVGVSAPAQEAAPEAAPSGVVADLNEPGTAASPEDPAHDQLRTLRREVEAAVNGGDWDQLTRYLTPMVIVTWLDGTQSHGQAAVLEYLRSKTEGDGAIVDRFTLTTEVTDLSDLYGSDTAIAFGTATSAFVLRGRELTVVGPWTVTMIREGDVWKIASAHASLGAFDNPLLTWASRLVWIASALTALMGLIVGLFFGRRRKPAASPS